MENTFNHDDYIYLIYGVVTGDTKAVKDLLDSGLSVNYQNKIGKSLVHLAGDSQQHEVLKVLKEYNADFNLEDYIDRNPIHTALSCHPWIDMEETLILLTKLGSHCNEDAYDLACEKGLAYIFD